MTAILAALERDPDINMHQCPIRVSAADTLALNGEEDVVAAGEQLIAALDQIKTWNDDPSAADIHVVNMSIGGVCLRYRRDRGAVPNLTPGEVVSKEQLSQRALGRRYMPYDRSIDTHVSNVRRKLADAGVTSPTIQSQRGVGYCLLVDE